MFKVAIHGVPRSGTTWLGSIFDSSPKVIYRHQPLFSYAFKSYLNEHSSAEEIGDFFNKIANSDDPFINQMEAKASHIIPSFKKESFTHIVYKEARYHHILKNMLEKDDAVKVIGIIRDPVKVLLSWKNAPKEFDADHWDFDEEWLKAPKKNQGRKEEFYGYEAWRFVASELLKLKELYPDRCTIITYESLVKNPIKEVNRLFEFCSLPLTKQTSDFICDSTNTNKNDEPYSVFRKNLNSRIVHDESTNRIIDYIKSDLQGTNLQRFLQS